MITLYRLLLGVLSPLALIFLVLEGSKRRGGKRFLRERLGILRVNSGHCQCWFHAASVGEVNAIAPMIRSATGLGAVLVTTNTPEAARLVAQQYGSEVNHCYCPLDFAWAIRGLLRRYRPGHVFVAETELWPNMFRVCAEAGVPVVIVNGRLSSKTRQANSLVKALYRDALERVKEVWARSAHDADGFVALGCPNERVKNLGNIKFAGALNHRPLSSDLDLPTRPFVLAASTRDGEELTVAEIWRELVHAPLLVVMPRHPPRGNLVVSQLREQKFVVAQRSRGEPVEANTDIYVVDTLGELGAFAQSSEWVFMGGTLVPVGGHNMLEPASLGKAVVTGWHLDNFEEESQYLLDRDGLWVARSREQLKEKFIELMNDPIARDTLALNAKAAMQEAASVLTEYESEFNRVVAVRTQ